MRLFFAFDLPQNVKERINALNLKIRATYPSLKTSWINMENYHLTLAFLGETASSEIPKILAIARSAAKSFSSLTLSTDSLGVFPSVKAPHVLWLGVHDKTTSLQTLTQNLRMGLTANSIKFDPKEFHPHISLARFRHPLRNTEQAELQKILNSEQMDSKKWNATNFSLLESLTQPSGSIIYSTLENISLGS